MRVLGIVIALGLGVALVGCSPRIPGDALTEVDGIVVTASPKEGRDASSGREALARS